MKITIKNKPIFGFIFKIFIGLLSVFTLVRFGKSLHPSCKEPMTF